MAAHDGEALKKIYRDPSWRDAVRERTRRVARPAGVQRRMGQALRRRDGEGREPRARRRDARRSSPGRRTRIRSTASSTSRCRRISTPCSWPSSCTTTRRRWAGSWPIPTPTSRCPTPAPISPSSATPGFGLHLMGHWSRDLGVLDLPQAVHRLTGQPARLFGLKDRGLLREGYAADLMLFDPKTVARGPKRRAHDLPAGAARLTDLARSACTASGSTAPGSPTTRASAPIPRRGRARCCGASQLSLWPA